MEYIKKRKENYGRNNTDSFNNKLQHINSNTDKYFQRINGD